eukprot:1546393-Prymnesium_polylepis.1
MLMCAIFAALRPAAAAMVGATTAYFHGYLPIELPRAAPTLATLCKELLNALVRGYIGKLQQARLTVQYARPPGPHLCVPRPVSPMQHTARAAHAAHSPSMRCTPTHGLIWPTPPSAQRAAVAASLPHRDPRP